MKRRWGQITTGIKDWLNKVKDDNILVSLFTFDSTSYKGPMYNTPSELLGALNEGIEANGGDNVLTSVGLDTFVEIMQSEQRVSKGTLNWLHYGAMLIGEDSEYPDKAINSLIEFKREKNIKFFFNVVSEVKKKIKLTTLATALEGVHYSLRNKADIGKGFAEALERDPMVSY